MVMSAPASSSSSSSSNLAMVVDERPPPQRPGGCVGIFFQLFDWNRRLTKNKLFCKKLLPPGGAKRISKKFAGNEKMHMAKLLLIADENRGGFPNTKKPEAGAIRSSDNADRDNGMCSPGLVARLMGLESMPATHHDKPRKAMDSDLYIDRSDTSSSSRHDQDLTLERNGHGKLESRPQKLQKTGFFDRLPVTARLGSEALQFNRSVLSPSRKQHQKLASPVKSPRLLSRKNSNRLMEAATKILEPNLRSRNQAKSALTYREGIDDLSLKRSKEHAGNSYVSPCKSCGTLVKVPDIRLNVEEQPPVMEYRSSSSSSDSSNAYFSHHGFAESMRKPSVNLKDESSTQSLAVQAKANVQSRSRNFMERKSQLQNDLPDQSKLRQDAASRCALKQNNLKQNQIPLVRENVVSGPKLCSRRQQGRRDSSALNASKDFIALNRDMNNCTWTRAAPKALDSQRTEMERNVRGNKSSVRKRRSINSPQVDNISVVNSTLPKQRSVRSDVHSGKEPGLISTRTINRNYFESESQKLGEGGCGSKDTSIVSFMFSAPMGHEFGSLSPAQATEKRRDGAELIHDNTSRSEKLMTDTKNGKSSSQRVAAISRDALSALLEEKIRELTCLDRDELVTADNVLSGSSASSILEELISALTTGGSVSQKKAVNCSVEFSPKDYSCYDSKDPSDCTNSHRPKPNINKIFQAEAKSGVPSGVLLTNDYDQPSPVSILEASFSNDSCLSGSLDRSSGQRPHLGFMERSCDKPQPWDPDLSDSATSTNARRVESERIPRSLDNISIMHNIDTCEVRFTESKRNYIREVISNAELLFGNTSYESDGAVNTSRDPIILDMLEALVNALCVSPECSLSSTDAREEVQFRRFLFDCMIEHLDLKYSRYCKSGYRAWAELPQFFSTDWLTREVYKEILSRMEMAGKNLDEIIEKELNHICGKRIDVEIEVFEAGMEIESDILQMLVDETTINLLEC